MSAGMSAPVRSRPHLSPTGQDRTGQDSTPSTEPPTYSPRAREATGDGAARLRAFLAAPPAVQRSFDRRVGDAIATELASRRRAVLEVADDPLWSEERLERTVPFDLDVRWDAGWDRRARAVRRAVLNPDDPFTPIREADPLVEIPAAIYVEALTGEEVPRSGSMRCPLPDHDDRSPSFRVMQHGWRCYGCQRSGSIYDLAAILWQIEPRGAGFREIHMQLRATFGVEGDRAAA